jgi:single-strand DNA-binding protein
MASFNRVTLIGNLTRDPEVRVTTSGKKIVGFGIACGRKTAQSEEVMFIDCQAWEKTGEFVEQYFKKGKPILLEGALKLEQWEDKTTGQKRSKHIVNVEKVHFLPANGRDVGGEDAGEPVERSVSVPKSTGAGGSPPPRSSATPPPRNATPPPAANARGQQQNLDVDDIPY